MPETRTGWSLILHGGAKEIPPQQEEAHRQGCLAALAAGQEVLESGGSAVAAVEAALRVLEDDSTFNAGAGAARNADHEVEMDAGLMDGATLDVGAVAAIRDVRHPISVARLMLRETPTLLVADGARRFAKDHGAEFGPAEGLVTRLKRLAGGERRDTVGCVALDRSGSIAAGTSTGGLEGSAPGRVGDSPLPGCGFYADDTVGGVAFSGDGESIVRTILASRVMRVMEGGTPEAAVEDALARMERVGGEAGAIALDRFGRIGWTHNSSHFAVAYTASGADEPRVFLRKDEAGDAGTGRGETTGAGRRA